MRLVLQANIDDPVNGDAVDGQAAVGGGGGWSGWCRGALRLREIRCRQQSPGQKATEKGDPEVPAGSRYLCFDGRVRVIHS
ncbi:MAG: hypothetical protein E6K49_07915 [Gammaproteobacteria bacterium]|nr:MAG: hypothetical protein E6K49_07915 [Gammaproteobacteria bacterium]